MYIGKRENRLKKALITNVYREKKGVNKKNANYYVYRKMRELCN